MTDREKILKEIERLIQNNADNHPDQHPGWGSNEIDTTGRAIWQILDYLKEWIGKLPPEPEAVNDVVIRIRTIPDWSFQVMKGIDNVRDGDYRIIREVKSWPSGEI